MYSNRKVKVMIAIQARSGSTRFPGKIFQSIGNKTCLERVIMQAHSAKVHSEKSIKSFSLSCDVCVLIPENDQKMLDYAGLAKATFPQVKFIVGDENDVLSRFYKAAKDIKPNYIVRLTSDCPLILDYIITKHINVIVHQNYDYVSNVEESCRQIADGFDCEALSMEALEWLNRHALDMEDREHVTTYLRSQKPTGFRQAFISMKLDTSNMKMSLDTQEDLERIRKYYHDHQFKIEKALKIFGSKHIYDL